MERYSRTEKIIGKDNLYKLKNLVILIVGIGGVGGAALEMIARMGIENIILVDYDVFEESNLNRQILSLTNNVGESKTYVAEKRVKEINPTCNINIYNEKVNEGFIEKLTYKIDYIIDACDDVRAKVLLTKYAIKNDIKIISACGTGNRLKPECLKITNIWQTEYDPLAKAFRNVLRKEKIYYKLPVVASLEKPVIKEEGYVGSIATVPNAAGILLASYVINDIIK